MKRLILIFAILGGVASSYAQCSKDHPIYRFTDPTDPKVVTSLGADPEFPFLRHLSTPQQVVAAMRSAEHNPRYARQVRELNDLLTEAGFTRGIKDVTVSAVSAYNVAAGTTGNMGTGHYNYIYARMEGGAAARAWRITSDGGCFVAFLSPCGNAFYPGEYTQPVSVVPAAPLEIAPIAVENTTAYTGNMPEKKKDCGCEDKCNTCDPCSYHHHDVYYPRYRRAYRHSSCCSW